MNSNFKAPRIPKDLQLTSRQCVVAKNEYAVVVLTNRGNFEGFHIQCYSILNSVLNESLGHIIERNRWRQATPEARANMANEYLEGFLQGLSGHVSAPVGTPVPMLARTSLAVERFSEWLVWVAQSATEKSYQEHRALEWDVNQMLDRTGGRI